MTRKHVRNALMVTILVICVVVTIHVFNWHDVMIALEQMRVGLLLGTALPMLLAIYSIRGLRWLFALGIRPTFGKFGQSFCANAVAAGLGVLTPFKAGEAIKVRLLPDETADAWRQGVSGFLLERIMDLFALLGTSAFGLLVHFGYRSISPIALLLPVIAGLGLRVLAVYALYLPLRAQRYLEAFSNVRRILGTAALSVPLWLMYACLWLAAIHAMGVAVQFSEVAIVLGGVMLAVVASMTPGGIGVSELGIRGILIWLGLSSQDADAAAIGIRLLTPLLVASGLFCLAPLVVIRRKHRRA